MLYFLVNVKLIFFQTRTTMPIPVQARRRVFLKVDIMKFINISTKVQKLLLILTIKELMSILIIKKLIPFQKNNISIYLVAKVALPDFSKVGKAMVGHVYPKLFQVEFFFEKF